MANKKFSEFVLKTSTSDVSHIVGYNGAENVQITPANFVTGGGTGVFLPLAGGTMSGDTIHNDNVKSIYGAGSDLEIYHDGSNSRIVDNGTGELRLQGTNLRLWASNGENYLTATEGGSVDLFHSNSKKLATTSTGISVTGSGVANKLVVDGASNGNISQFALTRTDNSWGIFNETNLRFYVQSGNTTTPSTQVLELGTTGNATFAGNVGLGVSPTAISTYRVLELNGSSNNGGYIGLKSDGTLQAEIFSSNGGLFMSSIISAPLIFKTNSTERMRLDASGKLGLGTSNPSRDGLNVFHTTTPYVHLTNTTTGDTSSDGGYLSLAGTELRLGNQEASGDLNLFVDNNSTVGIIIKSGGNVGIGTTSPTFKLHVDSSAASDNVAFIHHNSAAQSSGDVLKVRSDAGDNDGSSLLNVENNGGTALYVRGDRKVGIGTSTPSARLTISGDNSTASPQRVLKLGESTGVVGNGQYIQFSSSSNDTLGSQIQGTRTGAAAASDLRFLTTTVAVVTEKMRLTSAGDLLIGTTATPDGTSNFGSGFVKEADDRATLYLATSRSTAASLQVFFNTNGIVGSITVNGTATSYNTSSDYRLKEDLQDFKGLDMVSKIPVYDFKWKTDESRSYGVMAHELAEVLPDAVSGDKDAEEMQGVDYSKIVPLLVKSIQELSAKLEALECQCEKK